MSGHDSRYAADDSHGSDLLLDDATCGSAQGYRVDEAPVRIGIWLIENNIPQAIYDSTMLMGLETLGVVRTVAKYQRRTRLDHLPRLAALIGNRVKCMPTQ